MANSAFTRGGAISVAVKVLTDAQIKALPTTSVEIISAQGSTKLIIPYFVVARMAWAADYTNINASCGINVDISGAFLAGLFESTSSSVTALLAGGGPDGTIALFTINQLAKATVTTVTPAVNPHEHQGASHSGFYDSDLLNLPLKISANNQGSGDFSDGDAANTLQIVVYYTIVDFDF